MKERKRREIPQEAKQQHQDPLLLEIPLIHEEFVSRIGDLYCRKCATCKTKKKKIIKFYCHTSSFYFSNLFF